MTETAAILQTILAHKREEIEQRRHQRPVEELREWAKEQEGPRGFNDSLERRVAQKKTAVIAEIKRASPSKGVLCEKFDPLAIAHAYMMGGASCLSVLTDTKFFQGSGVILSLVRQHCPLPVLRKDFIIDEYQILESRAMGADCILLIAGIMPLQQLKDLFHAATEHQIDVLMEVHNEMELEEALAIGDDLRLIGINNRNLHTFEVDFNTTLNLSKQIPDDKLIVSESGISAHKDIQQLNDAGIYACLVGESLMVAADPAAQLKSLLV